MDKRKYARDFYSLWSQGTALYVKWATQNGISYAELSVLYALTAKDTLTQKAICESYGLPKQTVNAVIQHLKEKNYIFLKTSIKDRREKQVALTEIGDEYARKTLTSLFEIEEYICRTIRSKQFVQAIETKELFNTLFEKEMKRSSQSYEDE